MLSTLIFPVLKALWEMYGPIYNPRSFLVAFYSANVFPAVDAECGPQQWHAFSHKAAACIGCQRWCLLWVVWYCSPCGSCFHCSHAPHVSLAHVSEEALGRGLLQRLWYCSLHCCFSHKPGLEPLWFMPHTQEECPQSEQCPHWKNSPSGCWGH